MRRQIRIGIAEDHSIVRDGLVALLSEFDRIKIVFNVGNGEELLKAIKQIDTDIVLLDIEMPIMNGKAALDKIKKKFPKVKVIVITAFSEDVHIIDLVKMGANSFLPKDCKIDELTQAIYSVYELGTYYNQRVNAVMTRELKNTLKEEVVVDNEFSKQEREIIRLICENKTTKEIADEFSLSIKAIEFHRSKILRKTGTKSIAGLVIYAIQNNLYKLPK